MALLVKNGKLSGNIFAPPSKSIMQRALALSMLAKKTIALKNPSYCNDSLAVIDIITKLNSKVGKSEFELIVSNTPKSLPDTLNCGESGLAIRMFSPIVALYNKEISLTGTGSLKKRPHNMIEKPLKELGVYCETNKGFLPIKVKGPIKNNAVHVDGTQSSQFLTGLLIALSMLDFDTEIYVNNLKSKPYIDITLGVLKDFNINIENYKYEKFKILGGQKIALNDYWIEGDWSGAAFMLVAGAISGEVEVSGLNLNSFQGDRKILEVLNQVGCKYENTSESVRTSLNHLKPFSFDATNSPDLFPPLVALACFCEGKSSIRGVKRLIFKESNRALTLRDEFFKLGKKIELEDDIMNIYGTGDEVNSVMIDSHNDHRIAMAASVCALRSKSGVLINNFKCIDKSYPNFFNDFSKLGAKVEYGVKNE